MERLNFPLTSFFNYTPFILTTMDRYNVPVASFCLPDKKTTTYVAMFEMLQEVARVEANVVLSPTQLLLDFEDASRSAAAKVFPNVTTIRACRFHCTQNLVKRVRANRALLSVFNKDDNEKGKWLHGFLGLTCLPPDMVQDGYLELMAHASQEASFTKFADYVVETYVDTTRFSPNLWAREPSWTEPTSTNAAESYNGRYNDGHSSAHPNVHRTVQALKEQQEEVYILERTIRAGVPFSARGESLKVKKLTMKAWEEVKENKLEIFDYLAYVGGLNRQVKMQRQKKTV